ncbi:MAG: hypothetical protein FJ253_05105 [Phycisphaerae bacterium]|nr:hypothetical protein [Phycisphaerae bacterium]
MTATTMVARDTVRSAVEKVLRQDLKFGSIEVTDETKLVGGDLPLDSLDLLMVVTGTEKSLGVKLPSRRIDANAMRTVGSFVDFVCAELSATAGRR